MTVTTEQEVGRIEDKTICYQVHIRMPGLTRKADMSLIDTGDTDPDRLSVSKRILDSMEFRAIQRQVGFIRAYLKTKGLPAPEMKGGFYRIPVELVHQVVESIAEMRAEFFRLIGELVEALPVLKENAKTDLGSQFREEDYKGADELRAAFDVETRFLETGTPEKLRTVDEALYSAMEEEHKTTMRRMESVYEQMLQAELKGFVGKIREMLGVSESGKKKRFIVANVEKLSIFLKDAEFRNVTGSAELKHLCEGASQLLDGLDPEIARADEDYREALENSFGAIEDRLTELTEDAPRAISFDDEV